MPAIPVIARFVVYGLALFGTGVMIAPVIMGIYQTGADILWPFVMLSASVLIFSLARLVASFRTPKSPARQPSKSWALGEEEEL